MPLRFDTFTIDGKLNKEESVKTIKLNDDQYKLLLKSLQNYDDCGSYKSNRLKELVAVISAADFDEGGIVPQGQICNLDGKDEIVLPLDPKVAKIIREAIEKCKLSQPSPPWIPVSELLPEKTLTEYIVRLKSGFVTTMTYSDVPSPRWFKMRVDSECKDNPIMFWMPLPE